MLPCARTKLLMRLPGPLPGAECEQAVTSQQPSSTLRAGGAESEKCLLTELPRHRECALSVSVP